MTSTPDKFTVLYGCLLGTAVGDALGLPAEGLSPARIQKRWPGPWQMRLILRRGMFSDDTEHTYAVAQSLAEHPDNPAAFQRALAARLRWWFLTLPAGIGMATAKACLRLWLRFSPERSGVFSAGNGPAMRSAIIGAFLRENPAAIPAFVQASTCLTHTDPKADAAARAVAAAASCAARGEDRTAFAASLTEFSPEPEWHRAITLLHEYLAAAKTTVEYASSLGLEKGVSGYAFHTVPVALYAWLRHPDDFSLALTSALECGGDCDTVGAIVGGIAGAGLGPAGIPADWRLRLCDWPLSPAKLEAAARALTNGTPVPRLFWPARLLRNLFFLFVVLLHGFRRLLP